MDDLRLAGLRVEDRIVVLVSGDQRRRIISVPERTDMADLAQDAVLHQVVGVVVKHRVMALVTDCEQPVGLMGDLAHLLAFSNRVRHQLFGEDVLLGLHRFDRNRRMQPERQRDDDHFDLGIFEHLFLGVILLELLDVGSGVLLVVREFLDRPFLLGGTNVARADEVKVFTVVRANHRLANFVAGADDGCLDRPLAAPSPSSRSRSRPRAGGRRGRLRTSRRETPMPRSAFSRPKTRCSGVKLVIGRSLKSKTAV